MTCIIHLNCKINSLYLNNLSFLNLNYTISKLKKSFKIKNCEVPKVTLQFLSLTSNRLCKSHA